MSKLRALVLAALVFGCAGGGTATSASSATLLPIRHVVLIMEENHPWSATYGPAMPYLTSLANRYGVEAHRVALYHPSLPNYISLTSGSTLTSTGHSFIGTDCSPSLSCRSAARSIFGQAPLGWRVLAESMPWPCDHANSGLYAVRHTAAPYYLRIAPSCPARDVPYRKGTTPNISAGFTLIAPNLCDDAHDCSLSVADGWLRGIVPRILATPQYQSGSTLLEVTFDEGWGTSQTVETVLVNPRLHSRRVIMPAGNYALLRLNEELLHTPLLGLSARAPDLRPAFGL